MVGTKVGPIIAAIMIAHIENRPRYLLGIIDIGAIVMLNMTHHAHSTMAKNPNQNVFRRATCGIGGIRL
jgi:hypothetical protein